MMHGHTKIKKKYLYLYEYFIWYQLYLPLYCY